MTKRNAALTFGICFALAACTDSATNRTITAPDGIRAVGVAGSSVEMSGTDLSTFLTGEPSAIAADVGTEQVLTGGRASGHADITASGSGETYSFTARSTGAFPTAKGELEGHFVSSFNTFDLHLDINCLVVAGNRAALSGTVRKFVVNGVDVPVPANFEAAATVQDNGEGANDPPDQASFLNGFYTTPQVCRFLIGVGTLPSEKGNIQVSAQ